MPESDNVMVRWMRTSLEELWSALDSLFDEMSPADWRRPHGPDWTFDDLPYHLAYIDRLVVARPVEFGEALPFAELVQLSSLNELNRWNQANFAARPEGQEVRRSLEQMRASREHVRQVIAGSSDADLAKPAWFPLLHMRGFRPSIVNLGFCIGHTWQHLQEARVRHGHAGAIVGPQLTHAMLDGTMPVPGIPLYLNVPGTALFLDVGRAREQDFSFALNITGPGGGIWAFQASDEGWQVAGAEKTEADLVLSLDLDTYIKMRYFISDMAALVEAGDVEASDDEALSVYNELFVMPDLAFEFPQAP